MYLYHCRTPSKSMPHLLMTQADILATVLSLGQRSRIHQRRLISCPLKFKNLLELLNAINQNNFYKMRRCWVVDFVLHCYSRVSIASLLNSAKAMLRKKENTIVRDNLLVIVWWSSWSQRVHRKMTNICLFYLVIFKDTALFITRTDAKSEAHSSDGIR